MLCSKCSEVVQPVVAIDIDGTLGDFHDHFLTFSELYLGALPMDVPKDFEGAYGTSKTPFKDWFVDSYGVDHRVWHDIKLAYRQGAMKRSMPIYSGAARLCQEVREQGAELWLTTTRPYLRLDNVDPDTRAWLAHHGIDYDGLLYDEEKYARLAERVSNGRVIAVLDDLLEQVDAAAEAFGAGVPILRRSAYNRACAWGGAEARDLAEAQAAIVGRINQWRAEHE